MDMTAVSNVGYKPRVHFTERNVDAHDYNVDSKINTEVKQTKSLPVLLTVMCLETNTTSCFSQNHIFTKFILKTVLAKY